jgi:ribosomal protein S18 acetylase RimI-like enzyme
LADAYTFALRMAGPGDAELLWETFRTSRPESYVALPDNLLRVQHRAREAAYSASYPGAENCVVVTAGRNAGRVLVWWSDEECRIVDLAILPDERGRGLGELVVRSLADEAKRAGKPLRASVPSDNPGALRLYQRIGFNVVSRDGANFALELPAPKTLG